MKFENIEHEVIFKKLSYRRDPDIKENRLVDEITVETNLLLSDIHRFIDIMQKYRENFAYRHLNSHRKLLGPIIIFIKKIIRKILKWYIEPIAFQQTAFNNAVTPAIGKTTEILTELLSKVAELNNLYNISKNESAEKNKSYEAMRTELINTKGELKRVLENQEKDVQQVRIENRDLQIKFNDLNKHYEYMINQLKINMEDRMSIIEHSNDVYSKSVNEITESFKELGRLDFLKQDNSSTFIKQTFAQSGEDSILAYIVHVLGIPFNSISYIDLGANHAKELSNTYFFYSRGSSGVIVEANPDLIPELKFYRSRDIILNKCVDMQLGNAVDFYILSGDGLSTPDIETALEYCRINPALKIIDRKSVETITYQSIVDTYLGKTPTILSIDIEGKDFDILKSIDFEHHRPLILVIEVTDYDTKLNFNTKNQEIIDYLMNVEYVEYAYTGINSIFIDNKYLNERKEPKR